jgi:type I restriction enzyme S subunit
MAEIKQKPAIRFAGFTDAWEQRRLSDYLETSNEKNINDEYTKQDVLSVSGDVGIVNQIEFKGRSFAGVSVSNYGVVHTGDVVYTKSPLQFNPFGIIKTNKGRSGIVSTLYAVYHPRDNVYPDFVQIYFEQNARVNNYLHPLVNKGAKNDMKVSADNALKGYVTFPSVAEQQRISAFFAAIDRLITLHQHEYSKTVNIKKAMLEKMFPKDGANKPEIRFTGFTDAWEQRTIADCFTERNERSDVGELISVTINSGVMRAADLGRHDTSSDDKSNYKRVEVDDIAYNSMRMWQGASGHSPYSGILSPAYTVITPKEGIHSPFFACLFKLPKMVHAFQINSQGLTSDTWNLKFLSLSPITARVPKHDEQVKISESFSEIDRLITLHQRELEKLRSTIKIMLYCLLGRQSRSLYRRAIHV